MKKILILIAVMFSSVCFSQDTITSAEAKNYLGKEVVLKGRISSFRLASEGKSTNLINIDRAYPDQIFTVVVTNKYLAEKKIDITTAKGRFILVKGTVSVYDKDPKKIPQIVNPSVFEIK
jgi:hypothetical protein